MEQDKQKAEWEEEQERIKEDKEKAGEVFEPEPKEWEDITFKPFECIKEAFVVCIDTLGQDRELTPDERRFALSTVKSFKEIWERTEKESLTKDRDRQLAVLESDKEFMDNESAKVQDEEDRYVEEELRVDIEKDPELFDEELKDLYLRSFRLKFTTKLLTHEDFW
jgi:hypothetical protein